mgnify:FL=1
MRDYELEDKFRMECDSGTALIEYQGQRGIAIRLREPLGGVWKSDVVLVHWDNGEHTILPDEFDVISYDLFG